MEAPESARESCVCMIACARFRDRNHLCVLLVALEACASLTAEMHSTFISVSFLLKYADASQLMQIRSHVSICQVHDPLHD
jgi:hypothetical protein